ncbi:MAG: hypothetical protein IJS45_09735 [Clostridia bacterium]|nr:hypothetical protein [Clostridia bacterium]
MFKRIVSLFLVAVFLAVPVYAGTDDGFEYEDGYEYEMPEVENYLAHRPAETYVEGLGISEDDYAALAERIFGAAKNFEASCSILDFKIPINDTAGNLLNYMIKKGDPESFHIKSYSYSAKKVDGAYRFNIIYFQYNYTQEEYGAMLSEVRRTAHRLLLGIEGNDSLTDVQKALLIHDRLIVHCEYDVENYYGTGVMPAEDYTVYGALINRCCVCEGYSEAYCYLLDQVGIKNYLCDSSELGHMWNIIYIDGEKYHVDLTFDDPTFDITGSVYHEYFLCSTGKFMTYDHNASDYDTSPSSTAYDKAFWRGSESQFVLCNGEIYYINCSDGKLYKWTANGSVAVKDLGGRWYVSQNAYFPKKFTRLASDGKYLYYSLPKEVYRYDPVSGTQALIYKYNPDSTKPYFSIYGMTEDDGILTLDVYNTANYEMDTKATYGFAVKYRDPDPGLYDYNWGDWEYVDDPSCTEGGTARRVCKYNPDHVEYKEVEPLGHDYAGTVVSPKCTEGGYTLYVCSRCNGSYTADETEPLGHNYVEVVTSPTCTEGGHTLHLCLRCGDYYFTDETEPLGHDWGDWTVLFDAKCTEHGAECRTCRNDPAHVDAREIPATGHAYVGVVTDPTCTEGGYTTYTCSKCGDNYVDDETDPLGHSFSDTEKYCLNGCGAVNPDYVPVGFEVVCDGEVFGEFESGAEVTLPTLELIYDSHGAAYRFFTWSGYDVVRGRFSRNNRTPNGRIYTMTMPESEVTLTAVYSLVGDVNDDNRINSKDLSALKKVITSSVVLDDAGNDRADLDGNDRNNSSDISAMKKLLAGNYTVTR